MSDAATHYFYDLIDDMLELLGLTNGTCARDIADHYWCERRCGL